MGHPVQIVGVIGSGAMGRGIAQVCAAAGLEVWLHDAQSVAVDRALAVINEDLSQAVKRGKLADDARGATLARLRVASTLEQLGTCDLIVEAIVERLDAKRQLLQKLEAIVGERCIFATNTSSLSVTEIAAACAAPQRVAGWHFFNPVPRMKVVEVVKAPRTDVSVVEELVALTERLGHRAVTTADSPGFVVNHGGRAFVTEGLKMLAERAAGPATLDAIMRSAGFRMGPFELLDLTGLDVSVPVMESIHSQYYGDDRYRPTALARNRMAAGLLGRKAGQGFYRYVEGSPETEPTSLPARPAQLPTVWWPAEGSAAPSAAVLDLLPADLQRADEHEAQVLLLAPVGADLSTTVSRLGLDPTRAVAIDPVFAAASGVTLMVCPGTGAPALEAAQALFAARSVPSHVIADSPGYAAPRVVACIVNLACEMAQQGIAAPADIDLALRLGLGYPAGPFEWGDRLGPARVLAILEGLHSTFGDQRYRPAPWLVRRALLSLPLSTAERAV